jgi:hypothetical protein
LRHLFHEHPDADADAGEIVEDEKSLNEVDTSAPLAFAAFMRGSASLKMAPI